MATAIFGMGCYWAAEELLRQQDGVTATKVGYMAGDDDGATEAEVFSGALGHAEVVRVTFDPARLSYDTLLELFWANHDATDEAKPIVRSLIAPIDADQRAAAEASLARQPGTVRTDIVEGGRWWRAPEKDQLYLARQRAAAE